MTCTHSAYTCDGQCGCIDAAHVDDAAKLIKSAQYISYISRVCTQKEYVNKEVIFVTSRILSDMKTFTIQTTELNIVSPVPK